MAQLYVNLLYIPTQERRPMMLPEVPQILTEIGRQFDVAPGSIGVLADSSYNLVIEFTLTRGPHVVLRLDRTDSPSFALEAAILRFLDERSFPAPRLLAGHEEPFVLAGRPALLRRYCPGNAIGKTDLARADYSEHIAAAAAQLAKLHLVSGEFHFSGPVRGLFTEIERSRPAPSRRGWPDRAGGSAGPTCTPRR
jgi:hypothetical protein